MAQLERVRGMLDRARMHGDDRESAGYLDLLPSESGQPRTPVQAAMHNRAVAAIYERWWRPAGTMLMGPRGPRMADERKLAHEALALDQAGTVLDVACGPGNFTKSFGEALTGDGLAIGLDVSRPMLDRAVRDNSGDRVAYLRGDARNIPFPDQTFDAVSCFAALYLVPEPFVVLDELVRVLAPGGRLAVMTSCQSDRAVVRTAEKLVASASGTRMFGPDDITGALRRHALVRIEQRITGVAQFISAQRR